MNLPREERETVIVFNEVESDARCFTYNKKLIRRLSDLVETREECTQIDDNGIGGLTFEFPKKWVRVAATRQFTQEQKEALALRAMAMRREDEVL